MNVTSDEPWRELLRKPQPTKGVRQTPGGLLRLMRPGMYANPPLVKPPAPTDTPALSLERSA
jgi:hypothetical protein